MPNVYIVQVIRKFQFRPDITSWWNECVGQTLKVLGPPLPKKLIRDGKPIKATVAGVEKDSIMAYQVVEIEGVNIKVDSKWIPSHICMIKADLGKTEPPEPWK